MYLFNKANNQFIYIKDDEDGNRQAAMFKGLSDNAVILRTEDEITKLFDKIYIEQQEKKQFNSLHIEIELANSQKLNEQLKNELNNLNIRLNNVLSDFAIISDELKTLRIENAKIHEELLKEQQKNNQWEQKFAILNEVFQNISSEKIPNEPLENKQGGRRTGAGSKKGISLSDEHKDKISQSMMGKQNALKNKNNGENN